MLPQPHNFLNLCIIEFSPSFFNVSLIILKNKGGQSENNGTQTHFLPLASSSVAHHFPDYLRKTGGNK